MTLLPSLWPAWGLRPPVFFLKENIAVFSVLREILAKKMTVICQRNLLVFFSWKKTSFAVEFAEQRLLYCSIH